VVLKVVLIHSILIDGLITLAGLTVLALDSFLYSCVAITAVGLTTSLIEGNEKISDN
jgi:hypothetical protein